LAVGAAVTHGFQPAAKTQISDGSASVEKLNSGKNTANVPQNDGAAPDWRPVANAVRQSVVAIQVSTQNSGAEGSGVVINAEQAHVITNYHVIAEGGQIQIVLADGRIFQAEVLGSDPKTDLAVLKIKDPPQDLQEAELGDSAQVEVGDPVMAVGNPLGLDNTVTTGIVSAINRPVTTSASGTADDMAVINVIQIDAAINPGNSGGPLFDKEGKVIGITSSIATVSSGMFSEQSGSIGLGFAIPSALVSVIAPQLIADGSAEHAYLGVTLETTQVTFDGVTRQGVKITEVYADSAAATAGLKVGDVIVGIDGHPTTEMAALQAWVRTYAVGQQVTFTVVRDGKALDIQATLGKLDSAAAVASPDGPTVQPSSQPGYPNQQPGQEGGEGYFQDPFDMFNW
jgi:putative serine protease PepD